MRGFTYPDCSLQHFDFHPHTFLLPEDLEKLTQEMRHGKTPEGMPSELFILKPCFGGQGMGIRLIRSPEELPTQNLSDWLVQRYELHSTLLDTL
jgi:hypothetical protein